MIYKQKILFLTMIALTGLLSGCLFSSEQKIVDEAERTVKDAFLADKKNPTAETESFSIFLPEDFHIEEETENNLVLQRDDQLFLLFFNPLEKDNSELLYENIDRDDKLVNAIFKSEDQFGYVVAIPFEDKGEYEVIVGLGGKRIITVSGKGQIAEDAGLMMEMVRSITYK